MFSGIFKPKQTCDEKLNHLQKIREQKCNPYGKGWFREDDLDIKQRKECFQATMDAKKQLEECIKEEQIAPGSSSAYSAERKRF